MIERKLSSKSARSILLEEFNDIDVYVEDTAGGFKKLFKEIIGKAFQQKYKIEHVLPLGDRDSVIGECEKNQAKTGRKRIYIIDGDLYLLNNKEQKSLKGLYILPRYCIENFLIDENAIIELLFEEDHELEKKEIADKLKLSEWIIHNEDLLTKLFINYAACHKFVPELQTVGFKVTNLTNSNSGEVCPVKINKRIDDLRESVAKKIDINIFLDEVARIEEVINTQSNKLIKYVSGKSYLLPLLRTRCKSFAKCSVSDINFKLRLAIKANITELKNIEDYIAD